MKNNSIIKEDLKNICDSISDISQNFSGKTILISGGAGFLGKYIVYALQYLNENKLTKPCKIIVMDNYIVGTRGIFDEDPNLQVIEQDITKLFKVEEKVDYILHAASIASPVFYTNYPIETIDAGVYGTKNLLELAKEKNIKSFVFFSSSEVYGDPPSEKIPTSETYNGNVSFTGPRAHYDEPKRIGETICLTYGKVHNIPVKIVRPFNVYGPGMRLDDGRGITNFVVQGYKNSKIFVYGNGRNTRTWCYISDAIIGIFKVLLSDKQGEAYNVGTDRGEIEMADLAELTSSLMENNPEIVFMESPLNVYKDADVNRRCANINKIRSQLKFDPKVSLVRGLRRFILWVGEELKRQNSLASD
jgi:dTDP-glucose 4,6-dehydratase/UDP-glucuronate decarboxylase